ncbi:hypothetical protein BGY98DRAFT_938911 [Russula aff. rugulosa BPL654]|nr:hypothetical protein BGY98DRAFT_938911 [Russula aff. rugulosa BPL654]
MFFILFFVCIVFQLIPLHFLTLNVSLCVAQVTTHVVSANPTKFTKVGQYNPYVVWMATQDEYWPILPNSPSVDGHTRLVGQYHTCVVWMATQDWYRPILPITKVGQYHTCVVWMATQDWYGRSYQIHQGRPVPYLRSVDGHTRLVPADSTKSTKYRPIPPIHQGRPVLHLRSVDDRASVPADLTKFIIVGQYQSYMVWMTV